MSERGHFKDEGLNRLAGEGYNVAQFASFDQHGQPRYSRLIGQPQIIRLPQLRSWSTIC